MVLFIHLAYADSSASGNGIQQTVAALLSNTTTISESQINANIRKIRDEEMNILLNRFNNKSSSVLDQQTDTNKQMSPAPPPPPMPKTILSPQSTMEYSNGGYIDRKNHKRRSGMLLYSYSSDLVALFHF